MFKTLMILGALLIVSACSSTPIRSAGRINIEGTAVFKQNLLREAVYAQRNRSNTNN